METKGTEHFNIGNKITIFINKNGKKVYYPSQILDVLDEVTYIISGPIHKRQFVLLHRDEKIVISSVVENKGRYIFDAIVENRYIDNVYKLKIKKVSNIRKFQQRNYYRFEVEVPVTKYFSVKENDNENIFVEKCRTKDISGGGMRLYSNYEHNVGDIIGCEFNIDNCLINAKAEIVRIEDIDAFEYNYSIGVKFLEINETDRDKIIRFIFSEQRKLREKGLI